MLTEPGLTPRTVAIRANSSRVYRRPSWEYLQSGTEKKKKKHHDLTDSRRTTAGPDV